MLQMSYVGGCEAEGAKLGAVLGQGASENP